MNNLCPSAQNGAVSYPFNMEYFHKFEVPTIFPSGDMDDRQIAAIHNAALCMEGHIYHLDRSISADRLNS